MRRLIAWLRLGFSRRHMTASERYYDTYGQWPDH
jgi:hypothetical protein